MKKTIVILLLIILSVFAVASQRKKRPAPKPKPPSPKPEPNLPQPFNLGNCNSALWNARCAIAGPVCVSGAPNEGCLQEGGNCTDCYRASPAPQPKPRPKQRKGNDWQGAMIGRFVDGGFEVHNPGVWGKRGLRVGDVIVLVDGQKITPPMMVDLWKAKKFRVRQVREIATK